MPGARLFFVFGCCCLFIYLFVYWGIGVVLVKPLVAKTDVTHL